MRVVRVGIFVGEKRHAWEDIIEIIKEWSSVWEDGTTGDGSIILCTKLMNVYQF